MDAWGDGVDAVVAAVAGHTAALAALPATYATTAQAYYTPGLLWGFLGDSITDGNYGPVAYAYAFPSAAVRMAGGMVARLDSLEAGISGARTDEILAATDALLAAGIQGLVIMAGTNNVLRADLDPYYVIEMTAIIGKAKAAGIPVVLCLIPPMAASADVAIRNLIDGYNGWLRVAAGRLGCTLADTYTPLVDPTTGGLLTSCNSGDGVHPSQLGHTLMAGAVAKALQKAAGYTSTALNWPVVSKSPTNLAVDPLNAHAWVDGGGTGTAPARSLVADTSGRLAAGVWHQQDLDGTSAGGEWWTYPYSYLITTGFSAGDKVMVLAHIQIEDVTGTWVADTAADTAHATLEIEIGGGGGTVSVGAKRCPGICTAPGIYEIQISYVLTVAAGTTSIGLYSDFVVPTGKHIKMRIGAIGVINLTTQGSAAQFPWGHALVPFL